MTNWTFILLMIVLITILSCSIILLFQNHKIKTIMKNLHQMLDSAIDGSFAEHTFDESLLSSVESRLNQYLTASAISARNLSREKDKIKELLSDISHQTKTPIANILLYAQLLEEQDLPDESRDCVAALNGQAEKLNFLIGALVKLSRLEAGVLTLHPLSHPIELLLNEVMEQYGAKAKQKGVHLTAEWTDAYAVFDPKWTKEGLGNLVDNGIKYTPTGGSVHLSVTVYALFGRIDVSDTGIGISEAEQAKIFARFYRSQLVSDQEGVGIGLYLTRQILTEQGGYIKVASSLGNGAVFSLFLPREA